MRNINGALKVTKVIIKNWRVILQLPSKRRTIFYDMDNCVAEWCSYGDDNNILSSGKQLEEGYFRGLPVVDGSIEVLRILKFLGFDLRILSACEETQFCREEKREWIKEHLPFIDQENIFLVNKGESKTKYFVPGSILVDDYGPNLKQWAEVGGVAIKKVNSGRSKALPHIIDHSDIFSILDSLECVRGEKGGFCQ